MTTRITCPHCGQPLPSKIEKRIQDVIDVWNQIASQYRLPLVRRAASYKGKVRTLLKDEPDLVILRAAFVRFASNSFIREHRYGLSNFIPNRLKWLEFAGEDRHRVSMRETVRTCPDGPRRLTYADMAKAAGVPLDLWLTYHNIGEKD